MVKKSYLLLHVHHNHRVYWHSHKQCVHRYGGLAVSRGELTSTQVLKVSPASCFAKDFTSLTRVAADHAFLSTACPEGH